MKLITVNDRYCVVLKQLTVDRLSNMIHAEFTVELLWGQTAQRGDDIVCRGFVIQIEDPDLYAEWKEAGREAWMEHVFIELNQLFDIADKGLEGEEFFKEFARLPFGSMTSWPVENLRKRLDTVKLDLVDV